MSGLSQARSRLGEPPLRRLCEQVVQPLATRVTKGAWYRTWRLVSLDGSSLDVADTAENGASFGYPGASRRRKRLSAAPFRRAGGERHARAVRRQAGLLCGRNMVRLHGRSPHGTRALGAAPFGHWTRLTVLGALGAEGMVAAMSVEAATIAAVYYAYLDQVLLPELRHTKPDAVLVMDPRKSLRDFADLRAHKAPQVRALLDRSGFAYRYLPAYSPDLTPIEPAWAKVKAELCRVAARTVTALHEAVGPALNIVTPNDAAGFFRHRGYTRPSQPAVCSRPGNPLASGDGERAAPGADLAHRLPL